MHDCCETQGAVLAHTRRAFVKTVALGGGVALMLGPRAFAAGYCDVLLLSCIDYRLEHAVLNYMDGLGLEENYDHIALAGASLAALTNKRPAWGRTFWEHVQVALDLHKIKKVMVLDHRNCGAYRVFIGEWVERDPQTELRVHSQYLRRLRGQIGRRYAKLEVELGLMDLDGKVETIA